MAGVGKIPEGAGRAKHDMKAFEKKETSVSIKKPTSEDLPKKSGIEKASPLKNIFTSDGKNKIFSIIASGKGKNPKLDTFYLHWMLYHEKSVDACKWISKLFMNILKRS